MSEETKTAEEKINAMSMEELETFTGGAKNLRRIIDAAGITTCLIIIVWTNLVTLLVGGVALYMLGCISSGISEALTLIRERMNFLNSKSR